MCHATKINIANALRELMQTQPLRKIKVQDIMRLTGMTRQSFYYHFQDVYQVVEWELDRKLLRKLTYQGEEDLMSWILVFVDLMDSDFDFFRRLVRNLDSDILERNVLPVLQPHAAAYLFGPEAVDSSGFSEQENYAVHLLTYLLYNEVFLGHLSHRTQITGEVLSQRIEVFRKFVEAIHERI